MAILTLQEAKHFAAGLGAAAVPPASFRSWVNSSTTPKHFQEGTPNFEIYREMSLAEVERLLLLSASHYRRAHDLFSEASASWAFVTLYYGTYFAASAVLGMFGAWKLRNGLKVMEPVPTASGALRFEVTNLRSTYSGSHQQFWNFFYHNSRLLRPYVPARFHFALSPVSGDLTWPISNRNDLNYDSFKAIEIAEAHKASFDATTFPSSLPGVLNTQFRLLESMLSLAGWCAQSVGVETSALTGLSVKTTRIERVDQLVVKNHPAKLGNRVKTRLASTAGG